MIEPHQELGTSFLVGHLPRFFAQLCDMSVNMNDFGGFWLHNVSL